MYGNWQEHLGMIGTNQPLKISGKIEKPESWQLPTAPMMDRNDSYSISVDCDAACAERVHEATALYFVGVLPCDLRHGSAKRQQGERLGYVLP
jgi:hypothetical protein